MMNKRLAILLGIAVVLLGCYIAVAFSLDEGSWPRRFTQPKATAPARSSIEKQPKLKPLEEGYEEVAVRIVLPAEGEPLPEGDIGRGGQSCPWSKVTSIMGISLRDPHGIIVDSCLPEGCATTADLRPGDSICMVDGEVVRCPSGLFPHIKPGPDRREVELTVRRPQTAGEPTQAEEAGQSQGDVQE